MIKLNPITDDEPLLDKSKLLYALDQTIRYAEMNGGIDPPKPKRSTESSPIGARKTSTGRNTPPMNCSASRRC